MCFPFSGKTGCSIFEQLARQAVPLDRAPNILLKASDAGRVPFLQSNDILETRPAGSYWLPPRAPETKNPVSSPAPRSARSLSHGRVVCTYSLDTIRSTTLTRETVTATQDTAGRGRDISLRCKIIIFLVTAPTVTGRRVNERQSHPVMLRPQEQAPATDFPPEPDPQARNAAPSRCHRKEH
jgi:hypothetical protein